MKKAQITIYIIIGIIILFSLAMSIYIANRLWISPEIAPVDRPVKEYIESCIQQVGSDVLVSIGASGGYLDPLDSADINIVLSSSPAEGDALVMSQSTRQAIPFWFYMETPNTCKQCMLTSLQPSLEKIEAQVENYVDEHLEECLNGFEPFLKQGYIFETGDVKTDALLTEQSTRFIVEYPVKSKKLDVETRMEKFSADVDVPLKKMYQLADEITRHEKEEAFLESVVFHFISLHTGLDMSKLPPLGAITHDKYLVNWFKPMVESSIQQLLLSYVPLIQLAKTRSAKQVTEGGNAFEQGFFKALYLQFLKEDYPFDVNFAYLDWPLYFDITPRTGDILTGDVHIQEFPYNFATAFQTNYYEFYYDLSAPLLVEIRDPDALKGKGYSFNFALEFNVRDNKNFIEWNKGEGTVGFWDPENAVIETKEIESETGSCTKQGEQWFCDLTGKSYSGQVQCVQECISSESRMLPLKKVKKLFAEPEQKVSDTIIISVYDAVTRQPLKDVSMLYTCGRYKTIAVGATNLKGRLKTGLPFCINGQMSFEKDGYAKKIIGLTIEPEERKEIEIFLEPEAIITATIKKYPIQIKNLRELEYSQEPEPQLSSSYADIDSWEALGMAAMTGFSSQIISPLSLSMHWEEEGYKVGREQKNMKIYDRFCCDMPEPLGENYSAILMVEKLPEDPLEPVYFQAMMLDEGAEEDTIKMIPGRYKVTGMLIDHEGFTINAGCQEICTEYDMDTEYYVEEIVEGVSDPFGMVPEEKPECKTWSLFPEEDIVAKPSMMGGVMLDNTTGYWNVTREELNKGGVEFYFIQTLKPNCTVMQDCVLDVCVDVAEMQATGPYSLEYREYLEPEFISR